MAQNRLMELVVGLFVCLGVAALFILTLEASTTNTVGGGGTYQVTAEFNNIGSLTDRAPVTVAGVKVGRVTDIDFDPKTFEARVTMAISDKYDMLPVDTSASILTKGLLGEQYIGLTPGGSSKTLKNHDRIRFTQSALILEQVIGQFLFHKAQQSPGGQQ